MDRDDLVTLAAAAAALQTTHLRVLMLVKQQALAGELIDGEWYVERAALDRVCREGMTPLAGPSCRSSCTSGGCGCGSK